MTTDLAEKFSLFGDPQTDPYGYLGFVKNEDGSVKRKTNTPFPETPISSYDGSPNLLVKEIPVNQSKNTWVRVSLPKKTIESSVASKLPVLIYVHGGGFVICSAASSAFDEFYDVFTNDVQVVLVSIEYRNAPESRLPAAYEDCLEALGWVGKSSDEWLVKHADLSNTFVMGSSAGANIVYRVGLDASFRANELKPLKIKGLILHQPFFGGIERTESELRGMDGKILPPCVTDVMWELALPLGVDRDHEFSNPVKNVKSGQFDKVKDLKWKIMVTGYEGDALFDRQWEIVKMLEENGVSVAAHFDEGGHHGIESIDLTKLKGLCEVVIEFIISVVATQNTLESGIASS